MRMSAWRASLQLEAAAVGVGLIALGWLLMKMARPGEAYSAAKRRWQSTWFAMHVVRPTSGAEAAAITVITVI